MAYLGKSLLRRGLGVCRGGCSGDFSQAPVLAKFGAIGGALPNGVGSRRCKFTVELNDDDEEDFSSANFAISEVDKYHRRINMINELKTRDYYEKRHQLRRRLASQKQRNNKMRNIKQMAQWTSYFEEKGVPMPSMRRR